MHSRYILSALGATAAVDSTPSNNTSSTLSNLPVHIVTRFADFKFENLAIRSNGQILTTTTYPNASIYSIDPLGILPPTLIHTILNVTSATGIAEGEEDVFYVASGTLNLKNRSQTIPQSYSISELDVRGVHVLPDGTLTRQPTARRVANLTGAALPNGVAFARPHSKHLLVADSFRGLIWNVNVCDGTVEVALNDTSTKGMPSLGAASTGINGLKVHDGIMYWTSTGADRLWKLAIDDKGMPLPGLQPTLIANLTCDDLVVDKKGNIYVASPYDILTKVSPTGEQDVLTGTFSSNSSDLVGPTAVRFGRMASDRWSLYITTNGGLNGTVPSSCGISRIDLGIDSGECQWNGL